MREIKFRVWDKINKVMVTNENYLEYLDNKDLIDKNYDYSSDEWYPFYYIMLPLKYLQDFFKEDTYILEQYTGLKDKNGVEIYEGDVYTYKYAERYGRDEIEEILSKPDEHLLSTEKAVATMCMETDGYYCEDSYYGTRIFDIEVVGNIHER